MRIKIGNVVTEFLEIEAREVFKLDSDNRDINNPDVYRVWIMDHRDAGYNYTGDYKLDGTIETFQKAKANYEMVEHKLLTQGYCYIEDFENIEWRNL